MKIFSREKIEIWIVRRITSSRIFDLVLGKAKRHSKIVWRAVVFEEMIAGAPRPVRRKDPYSRYLIRVDTVSAKRGGTQ